MSECLGCICLKRMEIVAFSKIFMSNRATNKLTDRAMGSGKVSIIYKKSLVTYDNLCPARS